jgi:hypothetical protein
MKYLIGTDINTTTCRAEGYVMVRHNSKKNLKAIDKEEYFDIEKSNPTRWESGYLNNEDGQKFLVDDSKSFNDLVEILNANYDSVASFADYKSCPPELDNPTIYDFLHLASDLVSYYGNHYFSA